MEHVVARVFFDTLPKDMITVPSCHECDAGRGDGGPRDFHLDEEYMRNVLCLKTDLDTNAAATALVKGKVIPSIARSHTMQQWTVSTTHQVLQQTTSGILVPRLAYTVDLSRIERVIRKIIRGLYFAKERTALPLDVEIAVKAELSQDEFDHYLGQYSDPDQWFGVGKNIFLYKAMRSPERPYETGWLMIWYGAHACVAFTCTRAALEKQTMSSAGSPRFNTEIDH